MLTWIFIFKSMKHFLMDLTDCSSLKLWDEFFFIQRCENSWNMRTKVWKNFDFLIDYMRIFWSQWKYFCQSLLSISLFIFQRCSSIHLNLAYLRHKQKARKGIRIPQKLACKCSRYILNHFERPLKKCFISSPI